jgi:hypothetical protein
MKMGPIHPDADDALKILLGQIVDAEEPENPQEDEAMMGLLVAALEEGLDELGEGENDPDGEDGEEDE